MTKQDKKRVEELEDKFEAIKKTKWAKNTRIASGVIWNLFLLFFVIGLTLTVFGASVGAGYFASLVEKEPLRSKQEMRDEILSYEETSEIYTNGKYLRKVRADIDRKEVKLEDVSPYVINAVYATEDEYFNTHNGIVPKAVFRGLFQDVTNSDSQTGGSTLTQQLIKNQILTNEISYERKAKELLLAMRLEHFMTKEEILEAYLNIIPYGRNSNGGNVAGIEAAAEGIFNKTAKELNLAQAAYIAGIPQAPFAYTPFYNGSNGLKDEEGLKPGVNRMKTVLFRMKETEYITEKEYNEAIAYDITKDFRTAAPAPKSRDEYLTDEIQRSTIAILADKIAEEDGIDKDRLKEDKKLNEKYSILAERSMRNDGFRIHSTVDLQLYNAMNDVSENFSQYGFTTAVTATNKQTGEKKTEKLPVQVGATLLDNKTGKILAFVGGRDHEIEATNHATQTTRQPGSTIKPLLVYAPAIEFGLIGAGSPVVDVKFRAGSYAPANFIPTQELGIISARQALTTSQNLAALRLYQQMIDRRPAEFLEKMGYSSLVKHDYTNLSAALGGLEYGGTVQENTSAYSTLANSGQHVEPYIIEKIEDRSGKVVYQHKVEPVQVFSPQTAYIVTDMLRDVATSGTAKVMKSKLNFNVDIAAKSGTTNGFSDAWLLGYNPNVSLGVWLGYKYQTKSLEGPGNAQYGTASSRTNALYAQFMNAINQARPETVGQGVRFQQPKGVVNRSFCGISGLAPSAACSAAGLVRSDLFNANVMLPNKPDDSIISSASVSVKGTRYAALPSTPSEFITAGGVGVNQEFIKRMLGPLGGDASKLFPIKSSFASRVVSGAIFPADGAAPASVSASANGSVLTWSASPSNDVIGYYVYNGGTRVGTIRDGQSLSFPIGSGTYTVRAVDITGLTSAPSNAVTIAAETPKPEEKPDDSTNGSGDGDGNTGTTPPDSNTGADNKPKPPANGGGDTKPKPPANGGGDGKPKPPANGGDGKPKPPANGGGDGKPKPPANGGDGEGDSDGD
ncbi:transglycosylase domain-containing protein [Sporosarcina jeotgali]|uniref:Transglycosylase domain-containing protein n=1 Tax=Sporosarcina jeotgali TaxID=3020056 RepID=A0ABZ0KUV1_9BACL|nr:transglycosylase domain-containing protein [Sporosarcina sp. B2O-1]WOV83231.1 transglycosylase domain-containing protein [Sporosarcina sp. B2O-1]